MRSRDDFLLLPLAILLFLLWVASSYGSGSEQECYDTKEGYHQCLP